MFYISILLLVIKKKYCILLALSVFCDGQMCKMLFQIYELGAESPTPCQWAQDTSHAPNHLGLKSQWTLS